MGDKNQQNWWPVIPSDPAQALPIYDYTLGDKYQENIIDLNAGAGTNTQDSSPVPSGEIWVVQSICSFNNTNAMSLTHLGVQDGAAYTRLSMMLTPGANVGLLVHKDIYLYPTQFIRCKYIGCTLNDDLYLYLSGYKKNT